MSYELSEYIRAEAKKLRYRGEEYFEGMNEAADIIDMKESPITTFNPDEIQIDYVGMVRDFSVKFGHFISTKKFDGDKFPSFPTDVVRLRAMLIDEEAKEFNEWSYEHYDTLDSIPINIIEIADALADLLYVVFGAAIAYNIPIGEVFAEVHRSNMTKSMLKDEKSIKGKTIKGPNYIPPDIKSILFGGSK